MQVIEIGSHCQPAYATTSKSGARQIVTAEEKETV